MKGHVASTSNKDSEDMNTKNAIMVRKSLFVFNLEKASADKTERKTDNESPPICKRI